MKNETLQPTLQKYKGPKRLLQATICQKVDKLEEMNKFLERYNLPKLKQEEIETMNRQITSIEIEPVINKLQTNKSLGPEGFTGEFYQTFRKDLTPILLKLFHKIADEATLPTHSMRPALPRYQNQTHLPQKMKITRQYY